MVGQSVATYVKNVGRSTVGDARLFQRLVIIPQIFVFITYISIGAVLHEPPASSILRLAVVLYLLVVNMVVQSSLRRFSTRLLGFHLIALALLTGFSSLMVGQDPIVGVFLPMSVIVLTLNLVPLSGASALFCVASSGSVLLLIWLVGLAARHHSWTDETRGPLLICFAFALLILRAIFRAPQALTVTAGADVARRRSSGFKAQPPSVSEAPVAEGRLRADFSFILADELRAEFLWKLPAATVLFGTVTAAQSAALLAGHVDLLLAFVASAVLQIGLFVRNAHLRTARDLYLNALLVAAVCGGWWLMLVYDGSGGSSASQVSLVLFTLAFGSLPWPPAVTLSVPVIALICGFLRSPSGGEGLSCLLMLLGSGLAGVVGGLLSHHAMHLRVSMLVLKRAIDSGLSTLPLVHVLAQELITLTGSEHVLLICGDTRAEIINAESAKNSDVDPIFVRGLEAKVSGLGADEGTLQLTDLGAQFLPALADWFGNPPRRLIFLKTRAIVEERQEDLLLILPIRKRFHLVGVERVFRSAVCLSTSVRSALAATRSRFLSSDVLLEAQHSVAEREYELGQVVHLVNNIAQDISIQCEGLGESGANTAQGIRLIETLARNLSAGVSDIKLQRELVRMVIGDRTEDVDVSVLVDELQVYAEYRRHRRGDVFEVQNSAPSGTAVRVSSREFLETALRSLLRANATRMKQGGRVRLDVRLEGAEVKFEISDNGSLAQINGRTDDAGDSDSRERQFFGALAEVATRSEGRLVHRAATGEFLNTFELSLPAVHASGDVKIELGQWALLVDDNPQVTTFYARVAEALNLKYFAASSVSEAEHEVQQHGRPRLVITDIQLGSSSGLDLVRSLRRQFGDSLPVIVVSGHTADALADQVSEAGATQYLVKPVGRAKLFAEIRAILSM